MKIVLSEDERAELERLAGSPGKRAAKRAQIILACADNMPNAGVTQALGVALKTVRRWRRKFAVARLAGLKDERPIGRPKADLALSKLERIQLEQWAGQAQANPSLALRAKIVLRCADRVTDKQVAGELWVARSTVYRWRARFLAHRLNGLHHQLRPGRPQRSAPSPQRPYLPHQALAGIP